MKRIGILGDIGSGKSFVARSFGYPVFDADEEVAKIYKKDKKVFKKLKKLFPKFIFSFPVDKKEISNAILEKKINLKKIVKIVHIEVKKRMIIFLNRNQGSKIVILDIPLLLENKINKKSDILIFVDSHRKDILKRLTKRKNYNKKIFNLFQQIQLSPKLKKKKSNFIIKNNFKKSSVKNDIKTILNKIYK